MSAMLTCPSRQQLECLARGDSTPEMVEQLADHLEECARCAETIQALDIEDTLAESVRSSSAQRVGGAAGAEDKVVGELIQQVRTMRPAETATSTAGETRPTAVETGTTSRSAKLKLKLETILRPAQGPGELGRLGSYRVLKVLGMGGMGVVFRAEDTGLKRQVALKVMKRGTASNSSSRQRFIREAQAAAALEHDHIVTIYQVGEDNGVLYLAMPLLAGESLDACLKRRGRLPAAEVLRIGREMADGLAAAHERGLIHRDIKPANVWLETGRGRVKILDFGLARAMDDNTQLTRPGAVVGTPAYIAPEQANGKPVDPRADLFSLGCVLYKMSTGSQPFQGETLLSMLKAVALDQPPPPRDVSSDVPAELSNLIMRLLSKAPEDRPASAAHVAQALGALESGTDLAGSTVQHDLSTLEAVPGLSPAPAGRRRWPLMAASLALVALLGLGAYGAMFGLGLPGRPVAEAGQDAELTEPNTTVEDEAGAVNEEADEEGPEETAEDTPPPADEPRETAPSDNADSETVVAAGEPASAEQADGVAVLKTHCIKCHSGDEPKGGLRLDSAEGLAQGGDSGESAFVAAEPEKSLLWVRLAIDADMPPEEEIERPTTEEQQTIKAWLLAGAEYPDVAPSVATTDPAGSPGDELAAAAAGVFKQHCLKCHGQQKKTPGLDVRQIETLTSILPGKKRPYVVPGKPTESLLWKRVVQTGSMPPKNQPKLTDDEKQAVTRWIEAGAPAFAPPPEARPFISEEVVQQAILEHLRRTPESARRQQRFFTFHHLHNDRNVGDQELPLFKAALSKLLNSLSWEAEIVVPQAIDERQTVFAFDLRDLGWTERTEWDAVLSLYPYGLIHNATRRERDLAGDIAALAGNDLQRLRVRGDWFVARAARPPLYHTLLELPKTIRELEQQLEVDCEEDWLQSDLRRGALLQSKVSQQNRLLDRHKALHGAYWKSYDFISNDDTGSLLSHPLGPVFDDNPFNDRQAFVQDGGEMVFNLPNGLQGYYLTDGKGNRIDEGPIAVVRDSNETSGSPVIVNGVSCMSCHKNGVVRFEDTIGGSLTVSGSARVKVEELFASHDEMNRILDRDEERFLTALLKAVQPFLPVSTTAQLGEFPEEPVGVFARHYNNDLDLESVARELHYEDPEELRTAIRTNAEVRQLLGPLLTGAMIKRAAWESQAASSDSAFQKASTRLERGVPVDLR